MGELYAGLDLHSSNMYIGIMESESKRMVYRIGTGMTLGRYCRRWSRIMMK